VVIAAARSSSLREIIGLLPPIGSAIDGTPRSCAALLIVKLS
jgi:hypothetical protein